MKILVVNDDGYFALGLKLLVERVIQYATQLIVVAPRTEQSAKSHSLSFRKPLTLLKETDIISGVETYSLDGTPADCVIFAKNALSFNFDIVFSGINNGYNLGRDILYSGTVAGATEGALRGAKGVAISTQYNTINGIKSLNDILDKLFKSQIYKEAEVLNINLVENSLGIKITKQGTSTYGTHYEEIDGIYHSKLIKGNVLDEEGSDLYCIDNGYTSITPLNVKRTNIELYNKYK